MYKSCSKRNIPDHSLTGLSMGFGNGQDEKYGTFVSRMEGKALWG